MLPLIPISICLSILISPLLGDTARSSPELVLPLTSDQARSLYYSCQWPEIGVLRYDSSAAQLERKCRSFVWESEKVKTLLEIKIVAEFESRFLRSRYRMIYMPPEWIGKWGQLGPDYVLCQVKDDGKAIQPLRKFFPSIPVASPPDFETPRRAVESDIAFVPTDSAEAVEAAIDIVTAACPEHPLVFLNNIYEVYEISNTLMGEWIWTQYDVDDYIKHLLKAIRIVDVD